MLLKTPLKVLKLLSAMFCLMNIFWFAAQTSLYVQIVIQNKGLNEANIIYFDIFGCMFSVTYGVSHWMYAVNYLSLAYRIKDSLSRPWISYINIVFLVLNISIPIVGSLFLEKKLTVHSILYLLFEVVQIFTVCVLLFALKLIKNQVDEQGERTLNLFTLRLH